MDEQDKTSVVVHLNRRICSECENHLAGPSGVFCRKFMDDIIDERIAADCPEYDPVPWAQGRKP